MSRPRCGCESIEQWAEQSNQDRENQRGGVTEKLLIARRIERVAYQRGGPCREDAHEAEIAGAERSRQPRLADPQNDERNKLQKQA